MRILVFTHCETESFLRSKGVNLVKMMGGICSDGKENLKQDVLDDSFWKISYQKEGVQTTVLMDEKDGAMFLTDENYMSIRNIQILSEKQ